MNRLSVLLALMIVSIGACGRETPQTAAPAQAEPQAAPAAEQSTPGTPAPAASATAQSETEQATAAQESLSDATADDQSDASLERLAQLPPSQQLPGGRWKAGVHYTPIVPALPTNVPAGKVEVAEFFWYGCSHCYALEPFLQSWNKNKPEYVQFVRIPIMWGPVHRAHARLFYTLQALGREDLHQKVFDTIHQNRDMLVANDEQKTEEMHVAFATKNGIGADEFRKAYKSFSVNSNLSRAEELTKRYRVEGVPLLIVNGKYSTDVGKAGNHGNLLALLNDLAASEKR